MLRFLCTSTHMFLFLLPASPIVYLNFEQTIAGISISIHFQTVVANSNNFQTHPVCNLFSSNEINPRENIINNNVMQNGISKIVKSGRFSQFLKIGLEESFILETGGFSHTTSRRGQNIRRYTHLRSSTEELLLSSRKVHPPVSQIWWEAGFFDRSLSADSNLGVLRRGGGLLAIDKFRQRFYDFRGDVINV